MRYAFLQCILGKWSYPYYESSLNILLSTAIKLKFLCFLHGPFT